MPPGHCAALLSWPGPPQARPTPPTDLVERLARAGVAGVRLVRADTLIVPDAPADLEARIGEAAAAPLGATPVRPAVILRSGAELRGLLSRSPFPPGASASRTMVTFLHSDPDPTGARALATYRGPEPVRLIGREIWTLYGEEVARSPFTALPLARLLGTPVAARTLHVVRALAGLLAP